MSNYLKTTWKENLKKGITSSLTGVGKGWLNLHEKSKEIYEISKLKRFLTTVKYMMEVCLEVETAACVFLVNGKTPMCVNLQQMFPYQAHDGSLLFLVSLFSALRPCLPLLHLPLAPCQLRARLGAGLKRYLHAVPRWVPPDDSACRSGTGRMRGEHGPEDRKLVKTCG